MKERPIAYTAPFAFCAPLTVEVTRPIRYRLVRDDRRGSAVNGCVGGDYGAHYRPARGVNCDANEGAYSFRESHPALRFGASSGADARPAGRADHQTDYGVLAAPGAGGGRDADDVLAFYGDVRALFLEGEHLIGDADEFSAVTLHAGFDHFNALANPQATQIGPRALSLLGAESRGEFEEQQED